MKEIVISVVLSLALAAGAYVLFAPAPVSYPVGAAPGPDVYTWQHFYDNINVGGFDFATSSQGTPTFTALSFVKSHVIEHIAAAATTVTTPTNAALSAAGFLPNIGDSQVIYIHASTTKLTIAGGTGVIISTASSTKDIAPGQVGRLECVRLGVSEARNINCLLLAD